MSFTSKSITQLQSAFSTISDYIMPATLISLTFRSSIVGISSAFLNNCLNELTQNHYKWIHSLDDLKSGSRNLIFNWKLLKVQSGVRKLFTWTNVSIFNGKRPPIDNECGFIAACVKIINSFWHFLGSKYQFIVIMSSYVRSYCEWNGFIESTLSGKGIIKGGPIDYLPPLRKWFRLSIKTQRCPVQAKWPAVSRAVSN